MKNIKIICTAIFLLAGLSSFAQVADSTKLEQRKKDVLETYLGIKNSLFASDSLKASENAAKFSKAITMFRFKKLTLDQMNEATQTRVELVALAAEMEKSHNLNLQRKNFAILSEKLWIIAQRIKPAEQTLFQQRCTMTGVTWISDEKTIKNPYYPKNMATCGEIKATL